MWEAWDTWEREITEPGEFAQRAEVVFFAPSGFDHLPPSPTACAVGFILTPLRD
jgi:hypothetical protein